MRRSTEILVLALMLALPASARLTFTQRLQQKAKVQLKQDKELDLLVNGREPEPVPAPKPAPKQNPVPPKSAAPAKKQNPVAPTTPAVTKKTENVGGRPIAYTTQIGWRVKFFVGGGSRADKENAQQAGHDFKRVFPDVPVYMHFVSPHWICVAGDFVNKEDADALIRKIKASGLLGTKGMTVVKSRVKVPIY